MIRSITKYKNIVIWALVLNCKSMIRDRILSNKKFRYIARFMDMSEYAVAEELNNKPVEKKRNFVREVFLSVIFLVFLLLPTGGFSQGLEGIPAFVRTPQTLADWLSSEFKYQFELIDEWQSPQETIKSKTGDCEDFAVLASGVLKNLGIYNDILVVKFNGGKIAHAICAWKDNKGEFRFISNRKLFRTEEKTIERAIEKYYPDWEIIILTDEKSSYSRTITRKN